MAKEQLAATVYVTDPDTHQTVELAPGTLPEPRLAALVTNPVAWVDGKMPAAANKAAEQQDGEPDPTGDGPDGDSGAASDDSGDADQSSAQDDSKAASTAKKTAASKRAASKPARGRDAAEQGDSGA